MTFSDAGLRCSDAGLSFGLFLHPESPDGNGDRYCEVWSQYTRAANSDTNLIAEVENSSRHTHTHISSLEDDLKSNGLAPGVSGPLGEPHYQTRLTPSS
jgi:hypothetical protein